MENWKFSELEYTRPDFETAKEGDSSRLEVKYNVLAHNEGYQAKNNPDLPVFKLGDNWFDSTDDENTFVCPMLLAGIMKMGTISILLLGRRLFRLPQ